MAPLRLLPLLRCAAAAGVPTPDAGAARDAAWDAYVAATVAGAPHGLQAACVPVRYPHAGAYRGTAALFHGFSACPQQWWSLAPKLAAKGYDVLLPLTPGHGNNYSFPVNGTCFPGASAQCAGPLDDATHLPSSTDGYTTFVAQITAIVALAPANGTNVVAGLSVGGALAAAAGFHAVYGRQLVMNPMLQLASIVADDALRAANAVPLTRNDYFGWGDGCRHERSLGRGGICTFQISQAAAARDFGHDTAADLTSSFVAKHAQVAVLYDHADPVVSTSMTRQLVADYDKVLQPGRAQTCVLNFTMHSMLSMYDDVGANKWWLPHLECAIVAFLADGTPFPMSTATDKSEGDVAFCDIGCTADTCPPVVHNSTTPPSPMPDCPQPETAHA